jgi:VCBS repeat-containing protein
VYVSGAGARDFGGISFAGGGYVTKLDSDGNFEWVNSSGSRADAIAVDESTTESPTIYVTGDFAGTVDFGQTPADEIATLTSIGSTDAFLLKLNTDGSVLRVQGFGGDSADGHAFGRGLTVDESGSLFVTGRFEGTAFLYDQNGIALPGTGNSVTSAGGEFDAFVLKLGSDGSFSGVQRFGSLVQDEGLDVAVRGEQLYLTGRFVETASFDGDPVTVTSAGSYDAFFAALDASTLSPNWVRRAGGEGQEIARAICVDTEGLVHTIGQFEGTASFPNGEVRTAVPEGWRDLFLMKLNPALKTISGSVFADLNSDGTNDDGAAVPEGWTVYLDLNENGTHDTSEPTTTTSGNRGWFSFGNLEPGTYHVAQQVAPGWTQTLGPQEVVVSDDDVANIELGAYVPTTTKTYMVDTNSKIPNGVYRTLVSTMTVADSLTILDVNVGVDVSHSQVLDTFMWLTAPDGSQMYLLNNRHTLTGADFASTVFDDEAAFSIFDGLAPFDGSTDSSDGTYRPDERLSAFDHKNAQGQWSLNVNDHEKNRESGSLYGWFLEVTYIVPEGGNVPPVATGDAYSVDEDHTLNVGTLGVLDNDTDSDNDPLTAALVDQASHGTVVLNPDGSFVYTPDDDYSGPDSFTYVANDGQDESNPAMVTITVNPVDDAPIADAGGPYTVPLNGTVALDASGSTDPDLPSDILTYAWDLDGDGNFNDSTSVAPTFDATGLTDKKIVAIAVQVTDSTSNVSTDWTTVTVQAVPTELSFTSTGDPINIGDKKTVSSPIEISDTWAVVDTLTVQINLTHALESDLTARLVNSNGFAVDIDGPILSGNYAHEYVISAAAGQNLDGTWTLQVTDNTRDKKQGTLIEWTMTVEPAPVESAPAPLVADAALLAWGEPDSSDDDESDILTQTIADDLALLLLA